MLTKLKALRLELVVFLGGAVGMILEVVGSRVVSPYFGNSLIVWTNLIGVVLGSLSLGYYFGGKLADKEATYNKLEKMVFGGSLCLLGTAFLKEYVLGVVGRAFGGDLATASFLAILLLLGPTSLLLGVVAPMAAKLRLVDIKASGAVVGNLYALSTTGSIVGTFLAGFILIPMMGTSNLLYVLSLALVMVSILVLWQIKWKHVLLMFLIASLFVVNRRWGVLALGVLADVDSMYNRIVVRQIVDKKLQKVVMMSVDNAAIQSAIMPQYPDEDYAEYTKAFKRLRFTDRTLEKVLVIGGGGYVIPRSLLRTYPEALVSVVEIDPEITRMAQQYFFLKPSERLQIYHQDARYFVHNSREMYDLIVVDAFSSITPPSHLTTIEFMFELRKHLKEGGVMVLNMIAALEGKNSSFLQAEIATLQKVFPDVRKYVYEERRPSEIQNVYLLAYLDSNKSNWGGDIVQQTTKPLTDDWAPVEYLTRGYY